MKRQEKSPVEREDLYEFRFVSEASLSPDGTMAVCVVNQASKEDNTYHSSIWSVDLETKEKRLLASRGEAKKPVWMDSGLSGFYLLPAGTKKTMTRKNRSRRQPIMRSAFMAAKRPLL